MATVPLESVLILAAILFVMGLVGVLIRRNIVFVLLSIEVMFNACGLAFVTAGWYLSRPAGQAMYFFILTAAAAEVAVGLGLILHMRRAFGTLDTDKIDQMKG
jgi:NADH-quinone oxidoreductase subunit K